MFTTVGNGEAWLNSCFFVGGFDDATVLTVCTEQFEAL